MDIRCFCPPESVIPRSPKTVSYPFLKLVILSWTTAIFEASTTSSSDALFFPNLILFLKLSENKNGSWGTKPTLDLRLFKFRFWMVWPSTSICPFWTSYKRPMSSRIVDFPDPVFPIIASVCPFWTSKLMPFKASILVSSYVKCTFLKVIVPSIFDSNSVVLIMSGVCFRNSLILFWDASASCIKDVTHPIEATGHVSIFT